MPVVSEANSSTLVCPAHSASCPAISSYASSLTLAPDREAELDIKLRKLLEDDADEANKLTLEAPKVITAHRLEHTSMENIIKYARYAGASYIENITEWKGSPNCDSPDTAGTIVDIHFETDGDYPSNGFIAHKDGTREIIVSFRGSKSLEDWITDITFAFYRWPENVKDSQVHTGFYKAYKSAEDLIKRTLSDLVEKYPSYNIVLTGHSLGGSECSLLAADLVLAFPEWVSKISVFTYGQPRVGNEEFANWLSQQDIRIYRVVYQEDIVPHLPTLFLGYRHHTQEVFYLASGKDVAYGGDDPENPNQANSVGLFELCVHDHSRYPGLHN